MYTSILLELSMRERERERGRERERDVFTSAYFHILCHILSVNPRYHMLHYIHINLVRPVLSYGFLFLFFCNQSCLLLNVIIFSSCLYKLCFEVLSKSTFQNNRFTNLRFLFCYFLFFAFYVNSTPSLVIYFSSLRLLFLSSDPSFRTL